MKTRFYIFAGILSLLPLEIPICEGLDCYQCIEGWTSESCTDSIITCSAGDICSNTVTRKQFYGRLYNKGCMRPNQCYDLQLLNNRKTCQETPSTCVFCCEGRLCNKAETVHGLPMTIIMSMAVATLRVSLSVYSH
ncbi:hypothetical protein LOTGIDRAFT_153438 [Lottia gigantea]|uniref:UPAR/Ly6 domain-containing protein n=1 Tax=Lottia gigantea TaxID=225164 RepID=V4BXY5_LOTGI|nr:hypothetical protein LOTGIDRAFT_153438 [Lottia gigantea]ESO93959.1 hypothetical protein LOTGIDRAFT_153438 [Lottia gigantea]